MVMKHPGSENALMINVKGRLLDLNQPRLMGILNITPDSFYSGSRVEPGDDLLKTVETMLEEGADILDIGAVSTRPGAKVPDEEEELKRLLPALEGVIRNFPEAIISVDTFRGKIARACIERGAAIVNDISAWKLDPSILDVVSEYRVPYIIMHMAGTPDTMQESPQYEDVTGDVLRFFVEKLCILRERGLHDILIDPGFGFGKTVGHNFELLKNLEVFRILECPVLAGISRKSMICKVLKVNPGNALNGTTALHMVALLNGANILRVHDVKEARQVIDLYETYLQAGIEEQTPAI